MPISHKERKKAKKNVYELTVDHILTIKEAVKINDLYEQFHKDVFTSVPYFVRSFVLFAEDDPRIHIKSAQRAGTWCAPVDIEFPELKKNPIPTPKPKDKKLTNTDHIKQTSKKTSVNMSIDHEKTVDVPTKQEIFEDDEADDPEDFEEDRFFTDEDGIEFEGKLTDIDIDDNWYSINKRKLTTKGYTDIVKLYKYDDDHTSEYIAVTSENKKFHFIKSD